MTTPNLPFTALPIRSNNAIRETELCQAAAAGNLAEVTHLLDTATAADAKELNTEWTALHRAVQQGHEAIVLLLLSRGANVAANGPMGCHPLHVAISAHDASIARILLDHGAIKSLEVAPAGATALHLAVSTGSKELVELLLEKGANPQATIQGQAGLGETVLHMAVASWHDELLPLLLSTGLDVNAAGQKPAGQTALHIAAWYGYERAAQILLDAGADIDARYSDGQTALHRAATHGHIKMVELLVQSGADPMACSIAAYTPLCAAAAEGKTKCLEFLLEKSVDDMTEEEKGRVLISAAAADKTDSVAILLQHGVAIDARYDGVTGLEIASLHGIEKMAIFLLKNWPVTVSAQQSRKLAIEWANLKGQVRIAGLIKGDIPLLGDPHTGEFLLDGDSVAWTLALDSTWASRRRIMANPNASGLPAIRCRACFDLSFRRGRPKDVEIMHFVNSTSMGTSAAHGCRGCIMIRKYLEHLASVYNKDRSSFLEPSTGFTLRSLVYGGPLYVTIGKGPSVEIYTHPGFPTIWPVVGIARETPSTPWSDRRKAHLQSFINECLKNHSKCSYQVSKLPTRVIDVGLNERDQPRLHISNDQLASYVALSHCWGGSSPIVTTSSTLDAMQQGIPINNLPKTFKEAVAITRVLGIRYLWIDSLCIIQDSAEDWEREAVDMRNVYANCYVMIAADGSSNCYGGCFQEAIKNKPFSIPAEGPGGRNSKLYYRLSNILQDDQGEVCHRLHDAHSEFKPRALDTRGWTLQERILAPRILHFDKFEIGWECASLRACECQIVPTQLDIDSRFKNLSINIPNSQAEGGDEKRWLWSNIVEQFTHRNLTKYTDTLQALSGLASCMSSSAENEYLCGLWRDNLSGFLMWKVDYPHIRAQRLVDMPRRHDGYHAPSWSWASVIPPVNYQGLGGRKFFDDGKGWETPYPLSKGESEWPEREFLKVLEIQVVPKGLNPFGPPQSASLKVSGEVADAIFQPKKKELPNMSSSNGGLLVSTVVAQTPLLTADFDPDVLDKYGEVKDGDQLLLLFMGESRTSEEGMRKLPHGKLEGLYRIAFGKGLVLKLVAGQSEETYSRVGTFYYQGAEKWEKWRAARGERAVRMI